MNITPSIASLTTQGPIFWAAVAAIAAGMTLLLVSIAIQLRKSLTGNLGHRFSKNWQKPKILRKNAISQPKITITETGYGLAGKPAVGFEPPQKAQVAQIGPGDTQVLQALLLRLRQAGDQLESMQDQDQTLYEWAGNSLLKHHS